MNTWRPQHALSVVTGHGGLGVSVGVIRADQEFGALNVAVSRAGKVPAQLPARPMLSAAGRISTHRLSGQLRTQWTDSPPSIRIA